MKTAPPPLLVKRGDGAFLHLEDGRRITDCISSWWVTLHGHGDREIAEAIYKQALELEQVIFAGFTHEPAMRVAEELGKVLPTKLKHVFFSDNGSTAVEVSLKMAFQFWQNIGQTNKRKFVGFEGGYHGDTLGAMSAGGSSVFWDQYRPLMFEIETTEFPQTWDGDPERAVKETAALKKLTQIFETQHGQIAGIIMEPLVQGAAGMHMCSENFLRQVRFLCDEYDVLLIFDEVMTGFGRTGDWFASTKADVSPDIICLSKGLTGGFLPLSLTYCTERVYQAFFDDNVEKALFHSHSYTANPIACAAALASMKKLNRDQHLFRGFEDRHRQFATRYINPEPNNQNAKIGKLRFCGMIMAFDLIVDEANHYFNATGPALRAKFLESGLLLRPLGNTIYLMPPLCMDDSTLENVYETIANVLGLRENSSALVPALRAPSSNLNNSASSAFASNFSKS